MKKQVKRSQSSVEFIILITFVLIIFTFMALFIQSRTLEASNLRDRNYVDQLKNIVFNEVAIAESMPVNYSREFSLPVYIDGSEYQISLNQGIELIINFRQENYVYFLERDFNFASYLNSGINYITKKNFDNEIIYGFNTQYYNEDCLNGFYNGTHCWILGETGETCNQACTNALAWQCDGSGWVDSDCEILENNLGIDCGDTCSVGNGAKYPGYDVVGLQISCYSGTGNANCNANPVSSFRLCPCKEP